MPSRRRAARSQPRAGAPASPRRCASSARRCRRSCPASGARLATARSVVRPARRPGTPDEAARALAHALRAKAPPGRRERSLGMSALVVYESVYGNTREIAEAIAEGLGGADVTAVHEAPARPEGLDLL